MIKIFQKEIVAVFLFLLFLCYLFPFQKSTNREKGKIKTKGLMLNYEITPSFLKIYDKNNNIVYKLKAKKNTILLSTSYC